MAQIHVKTRREASDKGFGVVFANRKKLTEKELITLARGLGDDPNWKFLEKRLGKGDEDLATIKKWHDIFRAQKEEETLRLTAERKATENIATEGKGWRLIASTEAVKPVAQKQTGRQCGRSR